MRRGLIALTALLASACVSAGYADNGHPQYGTWGFDLSAMDKSVNPGDDFFMYANGGWSKSTEIPADRASWGAGQILTELVSNQNKELIADAIANAKPGTEGRKVAVREPAKK